MPPRNSRNTCKRKVTHPLYTAKILSQETIPIIDKALYDRVYPSSSTSKPRFQYGLTEVELSNLPQPNYSIVSEYFIEDMPNKPEEYIPFKQLTLEEQDARVDYDMDDEDAAWLGLINEKRRDANVDIIKPEIFEFLMDRYEKESRFERKNYFEENLIEEIPDDDAVCYICTSGVSYANNEILFCDMCNMAVHQECYGVPYVPEGQWLCRRCCHSPSQLLYCILCPKASGAFKQTDCGFWCHIICAIWIPEVQFSNSIFLDPICCIERIPASRWNLTCNICKIKDIGACVRCKHRTCRVAFHATCAQQAGYAMMMKVGTCGYKKQRVIGIYCPKHTPRDVSNNQSQNTNNMKVLRPHVVQSLCSNVELIPHIPPEKIKYISDFVEFEKKNIFIRRLLAYWAIKRRLRLGVPLIPSQSLLLKQTSHKEASDTHTSKEQMNVEPKIHVAQQKESKEEDILEKNKKYQELWQFRQDLEKARLLCELIKKREKLKNELVQIKYECLEYQFAPLIIYLRKFTDNLVELDTDNLFSKALDGSEAVSAKPTDFVQIRSKVNTYQYSSLKEYESDFQAMISSRITCCTKRTKIYKSAAKLKENSREKFILAYKEISKLEMENNQEDEDSYDSDLPEPLSPQVKSEPFENLSAPEFAMEIDYYGYEPKPSTSYQSSLWKRKREEEDDFEEETKAAVNIHEEDIKVAVNCQGEETRLAACTEEEDVKMAINCLSFNVKVEEEVKKKKTRRTKIKRSSKRLTRLEEEESLTGPLNTEYFPPSPQPSQSGVNRRTAVLFTKCKTKPKYQPPSPGDYNFTDDSD